MSRVWLIRYGYNYEHEHILGVFTSKYKAKKEVSKQILDGGELYDYANSRNGYIIISAYEVQ